MKKQSDAQFRGWMAGAILSKLYYHLTSYKTPRDGLRLSTINQVPQLK